MDGGKKPLGRSYLLDSAAQKRRKKKKKKMMIYCEDTNVLYNTRLFSIVQMKNANCVCFGWGTLCQ